MLRHLRAGHERRARRCQVGSVVGKRVADITEETRIADTPELLPPSQTALYPARPSSFWQRNSASMALATLDAFLIFMSFGLAYWLRYEVRWPAPFNRIIQEVLTINDVPFDNFLPYVTLLTGSLLALFAMKGVYRLPRNAGLLDHLGPIISASAGYTSHEKVKEIRIDTAMVTERPGMAPT